MSQSEDSEERKWLVRRLIELKIRVENMKDLDEQNTAVINLDDNKKVVLGHHFSLQNMPKSSLHYYCDRCSGIIWNILHSWYLCSGK